MLPIKLQFLLFGILLFAATAFAKTETGFLNRTATIGKTTYRYQVYVPANWNKNQKWPILLFLHGAGERGEDGFLQTNTGIGTAIRLKNERFPAIIVLPQCRKDVWWTAPDMEAQALKALEQSTKEFNGDTQRTYLTGLSMGGYGSWAIASKYPNKFAALTIICGGVKIPERLRNLPGMPMQPEGVDVYAECARKIGKTPTWIFHGDKDAAVPVEESRKMNEALKAAGGQVKYTEYPGINHNSWDKAYAEADLMTWMLSHKLGANAVASK